MYMGIDGCPGGWLAVGIDESGDWSVNVAEGLLVLLTAETSLSSCLIDMPIGLPGANSSAVRSCDILARKHLGCRRASVFSPPVREVLDCLEYETANGRSRQLTGRGISRQAWNLRHKITELDGLLRAWPGMQQQVRECHPELAFAELLGSPLPVSKKTEAGRSLREQLLQGVYSETTAVVEFCRKQYKRCTVRSDDVLDALALAVLAWRGRGCYASLPAEPEYDSVGLPMEIVCGLSAREGSF